MLRENVFRKFFGIFYRGIKTKRLKCSLLAYYIWNNKIEDNPTSCAKFANVLRAGFIGRIMCDEWCNKAAEFYGWSLGKKQDCHHTCFVTDPLEWLGR